MASPELQMIVDMMRTNPPLAGTTFLQMRANMENLTAATPVADDVDLQAVSADGVPAEWTTAAGAAADRVIVYFHGGGYCIGSVQTHRLLCADLSRACGARVLSVDYRLAPEHPHPAAVDDALSAYRFVRESGIAPSRIVFAGDSAGGGLTAAALIAVRDAGEPLPAAGVCISPWMDLTQSAASMVSKAAADPMVRKEGLDAFARAYAGGADPQAPTISPLFADLHGLPPMLVHVGTAETLLDDSTRFAERARAAGVPIEIEVWDDMIHVWHAFAFILPEGGQAIEGIGAFVRARLG